MTPPQLGERGPNQQRGENVAAGCDSCASGIPQPECREGSANAQAEANRQQENRFEAIEGQIKRGERIMLWLTGAIGFFALCSVVVGTLQWSVMSRQLTEMKNGAADTRRMIVAAEKQAAAAAAAERVKERAWVLLRSAHLTDVRAGMVTGIDLEVENVGGTPAAEVAVTLAKTVVPGGLRSSFNAELRLDGGFELNAGVGPQQVATTTVPVVWVFTPEIVAAMRSGKAPLHIEGLLGYTDIFGQRHHTQICYNASGRDLRMWPCGGNNKSD